MLCCLRGKEQRSDSGVLTGQTNIWQSCSTNLGCNHRSDYNKIKFCSENFCLISAFAPWKQSFSSWTVELGLDHCSLDKSGGGNNTWLRFTSSLEWYIMNHMRSFSTLTKYSISLIDFEDVDALYSFVSRTNQRGVRAWDCCDAGAWTCWRLQWMIVVKLRKWDTGRVVLIRFKWRLMKNQRKHCQLQEVPEQWFRSCSGLPYQV